MRFERAMDDVIQIRVARDEKRALMKAARRRGLKLSEMIRQSLREVAS